MQQCGPRVEDRASREMLLETVFVLIIFVLLFARPSLLKWKKAKFRIPIAHDDEAQKQQTEDLAQSLEVDAVGNGENDSRFGLLSDNFDLDNQ
mmetsp:Transcript_29801/g.79228  ORF Transcript_29801/g.79228 Transcript_29801/m.79228 type:complete len:93 (+) Transcript_29801:88-366(+)